MKKHSIKKLIVTFILMSSIIMLTACNVLGGCDFLSVAVTGISFKEDTLNMTIGEEKDINSTFVTVSPDYASNKKFEISSSDESVLSVSSSKRIKALKVGTVTLTAKSVNKGFTDTCEVTVDYADLSELAIKTDDKLMQYVGNLSAINFTTEMNENVNPELSAAWFVNDVEVIGNNTGIFNYVPENTAGIYTIKVKIGDYSAVKEVKIYEPFATAASVDPSAELVQDEGQYSNVSFSLDFVNPEGNPEPVIEWLVNGKIVVIGQKVFNYLPTITGKYIIQVCVNGEYVIFDGLSDNITVTALGTLTPQNVKVDMDNCYPSIMITWNSVEVEVGYQIRIDGVEIYRTDNASFKDRFNGSSFDAKGLIDVTVPHSIAVKSLGDGGAFVPSQYSSVVNTKAINSNALQYMSNYYYGGNRYAVNLEEYVDLVTYAMLYRETKFDTYIAFPLTNAQKMEPYLLLKYAFDYYSPTGRYSLGADLKGSVLTTRLEYISDNFPSEAMGWVGENKDMALNAFRPHVNTDSTKNRPSSYEFAIDKVTKTARVNTSEQLYQVVEFGYKPIIDDISSQSYKMYRYAKSVLRKICTDEMTDVEKAHAIYDWIMWHTTYDTEATYGLPGLTDDENLDRSCTLTAYYLEGVFDDVYSLAVCDGLSKAYSLMCNIEGIECIRVVGTGGSTSPDAGHAWNKVKIDGSWYIVDCTWGDASFEGREMATHEYFLKTDAQTSNHYEKDVSDYPKTSKISYNWYDTKFMYGGKTLDYYIDAEGAALQQEINVLINYLVETRPSDTEAYGFDIRVSSRAITELKDKTSSNPIRKAFTKEEIKTSEYSIIANFNEFGISGAEDGNYYFYIWLK